MVDFGVVKLLDNAATAFGARNFTAIGAVFGTPQYMAPEQALAREVDGRADIYSMGILLFEMLTGRRPVSAAKTLTTASPCTE
jgi:serine/threonine protein kinase